MAEESIDEGVLLANMAGRGSYENCSTRWRDWHARLLEYKHGIINRTDGASRTFRARWLETPWDLQLCVYA